MEIQNRVFFPGINALRFFAALAVIITHTELLKGVFGLHSYWDTPLFFNLGGLGVYFFFVLSGFLITYLLLKEKENFGVIKIKDFYMRRVLRIWPLYYLIVILGFFVLPHFTQIKIPYLEKDFTENFNLNLILYLCILPNLAFAMFSAVPHIGQIWSIGVEEQFYIVWPWLIARSKNVLRSLVMIIAGLILIKIGVLIIGKFYGGERWYLTLKNFVAMSKFECMAFGGVGAYFLFYNKVNILKIIYNPIIFNVSIILIPVLIYFTPSFLQDGIHIIYSLVFLIIIMYIAAGKKTLLKLENKYLNYLGKISYGIYMYHFIVISIVIFGIKNLSLNPITFNIILYSSVIGLTVGVSALSYEFFENKFIKLKERFTTVKSGSCKGF